LKEFKIIFLIFFALFSFHAKTEIIKSLDISGISSLSKGTVLSYLPLEIGDEYDETISDTIIQKLFSSGLFEDIEIKFLEGKLFIKVVERPVISFIEISGYKNDNVINKDAMELTLQDLKLTAGNIFKKEELERLIRKIKNQYSVSGYYNSNIDVKINKDNINRVGIEIDIFEGDVAKISSFRIIGNKVFDEDFLLDQFNIGEPDFYLLNLYTERDHFSQLEFDSGLEKIRSLYINKGYLDFEISNKNISLSEKKDEIQISISLSEGEIYKIGSINFEGDFLNISTSDLANMLNVKTTDNFERKKLIEGLESINDFFGNQGFAFASVDAKSIENKAEHIVDLAIEINVNDRIFINRINITGNTRTQDNVIRREMNLLEGEIYSKTKLDKSIENIRRLSFFKDVSLKTSKNPGMPDKVDIFIEVDENKTGEFSVGLSQSSTTGAAFNLGIKEKNFLGTGNTLNAELVNSEAVEQISFFFLDPDFNGKKHTISYGVFSKKTDSKYIDLSSYTLNEIGLNASYGIPVSEYVKFTNGFRFASADMKCGYTYLQYESDQCDDKADIDFTFASSLAENSLNDSIYPTDGKKNNIKFTFSMPFSDFDYYSFNLSHDSYYPLDKNLTFKFDSKIDFIGSYNKSPVPFYKKLYGGGSDSIRGFDFNSLGPRYPDDSVKGGEFSVLMSSSIISPIGFLDDSENMRMGAFIDLGSINESLSNVSFSDFRASTGVAFSWYTPIGPLSLNWSKPVISKAGDSLKTFSFTLGSSF